MKPLDRAFNVAVLQCAAIVWPQGFDVSPGTTASLAGIKREIETRGRLTVWSGASDKTIFACAGVNHAFRAWHDYHHWRGKHDFTPQGEREVAERQKRDIVALYGAGDISRRFALLIECEVMGQLDYEARTGAFPDDQMRFALDWLSTH